jgi:enoyl-CoA hydratase/carnithine racemase
MADDTYVAQVGTSVGSVACGGATQWLSIHVGDRRAREMQFHNPRIPAKQALDWGLVNRVVPRAQLDEAVNEMAQIALDKFPECTRYTKQQVNYWKEQQGKPMFAELNLALDDGAEVRAVFWIPPVARGAATGVPVQPPGGAPPPGGQRR